MCLIGADVGNKNNRISRFANYLRNLLPSADSAVMELAAKTVGKLALDSGTYADQYVEFEVKRAFEWLGGVRNEPKRYAAVSNYIFNTVNKCYKLYIYLFHRCLYLEKLLLWSQLFFFNMLLNSLT